MFLAAELPRPVRAMDDAARSLRTSSAIGRHDVPPCRERLRASAASTLPRALYWHSIRATNGQIRGKNGHSPVIEKRRNPHVSGDRKRWYSAVFQGCNPLLAHVELELIHSSISNGFHGMACLKWWLFMVAYSMLIAWLQYLKPRITGMNNTV